VNHTTWKNISDSKPNICGEILCYFLLFFNVSNVTFFHFNCEFLVGFDIQSQYRLILNLDQSPKSARESPRTTGLSKL